jgi:hypothetical protein
MLSRGDQESVREELERLTEARSGQDDALQALSRRLEEVESRVAALEASGPRRGWLGRKGK